MDLSIKLHLECTQKTNIRWLHNALSLGISQSFKRGLNDITEIWVEMC